MQPPSQALSPLPPLVREPGNEVVKFAVLTCEDSGHKRGEHEKKKREEQAARVVEDFIAVVSDAVI